MICYRCCCNKCKFSVELYPFQSKKECEEIGNRACFNCDECYFFGMDNDKLSRNVIKFECDKFKMSDYYTELEAKRRRRDFKII